MIAMWLSFHVICISTATVVYGTVAAIHGIRIKVKTQIDKQTRFKEKNIRWVLSLC